MLSTNENSNGTLLPAVLNITVETYQPYQNQKDTGAAVELVVSSRQEQAWARRDDLSLKAVRSKFIRLWAAVQRQGLTKTARENALQSNTTANLMAWLLVGQMTAWSDEALTTFNVREAWHVARVLYSDMLEHI